MSCYNNGKCDCYCYGDRRLIKLILLLEHDFLCKLVKPILVSQLQTSLCEGRGNDCRAGR